MTGDGHRTLVALFARLMTDRFVRDDGKELPKRPRILARFPAGLWLDYFSMHDPSTAMEAWISSMVNGDNFDFSVF